jgi:uncharacterized protein DUF3303
MLFVSIAKAKEASTMKQRVARRLKWEYPAGARVIGDYWLLGNETLITIVETDSIAPIMSAIAEWDDVFEFTVSPAVTAEEGLQLAKKMAA